MANILNFIFLVNGLEVCALKRYVEFQGRFKSAMSAQENILYNQSGWLGRAASWHEGNHCDCDQLIANFNIATGDDDFRVWNEFDLSYVSSWHALNRLHCRLSLIWKTFCEKSVCLARCDSEQKKDLAEAWARNCADRWQKEADDFKKSIRKQLHLQHTDEFFHELQEETNAQEQFDLWLKKVTQTFPPCEVCTELMPDLERQETGLPDACKKENNVHKTVSKLLDSAITEETPDAPELSDTDAPELSGSADSHHNRSAPSLVIVSEFCQHECSKEAETLDQIWATPVGTNLTEQKVYDAIGFTWVKGWHFMNRMHCYVALASLKWCQRDSCYRRCEKPKSECQTTWEGNYTEGIETLRQKTLDELMVRNIPSGHAHRWWGAVAKTFEACPLCVDQSVTRSIPQPCWHEYNTYTEVWFQSLPEVKVDHHRGSFYRSPSGIFYCVCGGIAIVLSVYWCARRFHHWVCHQLPVNKR